MADELKDVSPLRLLLRNRPLGLFSDIDGTLAPIVTRPEEARITPRCRELLQALTAEGVRLALITGRPLEAARMVSGLDAVAYAAWHGLELCVDGQVETQVELRESIVRAWQALAELNGLADLGVEMELKGPGLAFHYRRASDEEAAKRAILEALERSRAARAFRVHKGRKLIELRPPLGVDKGTALVKLVERLGVSALICLGDDETDVDMFRAVGRLRDAGLPGVSVAVENEEAAPAVAESADYFVRGVAGVEWLLAEILRTVRDQST